MCLRKSIGGTFGLSTLSGRCRNNALKGVSSAFEGLQRSLFSEADKGLKVCRCLDKVHRRVESASKEIKKTAQKTGQEKIPKNSGPPNERPWNLPVKGGKC